MKSSLKRILALVFALAMILSCAVFMTTAADDVVATTGAPESFALMEGASVRLDEEHSGLRFETRILTAELEALGSDVTIGTLIIPTDLVSGEITVATPNVLNLTSKDQGARYTVDGDYTVFYAALVDIKAQNYTRAFSARSYVKVGDDYYYTAYSEENNSRSVYQVAVSAWKDGYKNNAVIKNYLDKVLVLDSFLRVFNSIPDYTSPYNVSYTYTADASSGVITSGTLKVTAKDGTLADGDIATVSIIGETAYTGGWTVANNELTAPYTAVYHNDFSTLVQRKAGGSSAAYLTAGKPFKITLPKNTTGAVAEYSADGKTPYGYLLFTSATDSAYPTIYADGTDLQSQLSGSKNALVLSMSLKLPEGVTSMRTCTFNLRGPDVTGLQSANNLVPFFKLEGNQVKLCDGTSIATVTDSEWVDITVTLDFKNAKVYGYRNGVLIASSALQIPEGYPDAEKVSMLDWAKANTYTQLFLGKLGKGTGAAGVCIDNVCARTFTID